MTYKHFNKLKNQSLIVQKKAHFQEKRGYHFFLD